jgi:hypothetical protein
VGFSKREIAANGRDVVLRSPIRKRTPLRNQVPAPSRARFALPHQVLGQVVASAEVSEVDDATEEEIEEANGSLVDHQFTHRVFDPKCRACVRGRAQPSWSGLDEGISQ